ncbi:MAG: hypothetical protein AAB660_00780 [Patescibacteria group bacterium]
MILDPNKGGLMAETIGSKLDELTLKYFLETGELLPELMEVTETSRDLLEELVDSVGFPPALNTVIRRQMEVR